MLLKLSIFDSRIEENMFLYVDSIYTSINRCTCEKIEHPNLFTWYFLMLEYIPEITMHCVPYRETSSGVILRQGTTIGK